MNVMDSLLAPIDTPAAWRGADSAGSDAWRRKLTVAGIDVLERATEAVRNATCPGFGPGVFPVPELAPLSGPPASRFSVDTQSGALRGGTIAGRSALL
jgi:hypothetical protein